MSLITNIIAVEYSYPHGVAIIQTYRCVRIKLLHVFVFFYHTDQYFDKSYGYDTYFGEGSGAVHLNHLECSGNEYRLVDCGSSRTEQDHRYDWSISCKNGSSYLDY